MEFHWKVYIHNGKKIRNGIGKKETEGKEEERERAKERKEERRKALPES